MSKMQSLPLNNGGSIPIMAYGTGTAIIRRENEGQIDEGRVRNFVTAIQTGFHHLDTAQMYKTEQELGLAIQRAGVSRDQLFVSSKISADFLHVERICGESLQKLGLKYLDCYLMHVPHWAKSPQELQEGWRQMEALVSSGKVRSIGVSNFDVSHLQTILETATIKPVVNQVEFHPYLPQVELRDFQKQHGIVLTAYGVLAPLTRNMPGPLDGVLEELARKYGVTKEKILLRWCIDLGVVAITTTRNLSRIQEYYDVLGFQLDPQDRERISEAGLQGDGAKEYVPRIERYVQMKKKEDAAAEEARKAEEKKE